MVKRCPHAIWDPLGEQTQPRMSAHDIVCLHTMVGYGTGTRAMFKKNGYGGTESTYGVCGIWGSDETVNIEGRAYQWQDRAYTADANLKGNPRVISIETADNAPALPDNIVKLTPKMVDAVVNIIAWECSIEAHSECPTTWDCYIGTQWSGMIVAIPPVLIDDSKPNRRGIGYHRQGCDPWRVPGGELWSAKYGKECPGTRRIAQLRDEIIPLVQAKLRGEDMATAEETWNWDGIPAPEREPDKAGNPAWKPTSYFKAMLNTIDEVSVATDDALAQVEANRDAIAALTTRLAALDLSAVTAALAQASTDAAAKVAQAGEELLAKLDAIRLDINRG
jgi:hypothetical protein